MRLKVCERREISSETGDSGSRVPRSSVPISETVSVMRTTRASVRWATVHAMAKPRRAVAAQASKQLIASRSSISEPATSEKPRKMPPPLADARYTTRNGFFHPSTSRLAGTPGTRCALNLADESFFRLRSYPDRFQPRSDLQEEHGVLLAAVGRGRHLM